MWARVNAMPGYHQVCLRSGSYLAASRVALGGARTEHEVFLFVIEPEGHLTRLKRSVTFDMAGLDEQEIEARLAQIAESLFANRRVSSD